MPEVSPDRRLQREVGPAHQKGPAAGRRERGGPRQVRETARLPAARRRRGRLPDLWKEVRDPVPAVAACSWISSRDFPTRKSSNGRSRPRPASPRRRPSASRRCRHASPGSQRDGNKYLREFDIIRDGWLESKTNRDCAFTSSLLHQSSDFVRAALLQKAGAGRDSGAGRLCRRLRLRSARVTPTISVRVGRRRASD